MLSQPRLGRRIVVRFGRFGLVGLSGLAVNTVAMAVFTAGLSVNYLLAAVLATQVSTTWNFLGSELWAFNGSAIGRSRRFLAFAAMNNIGLSRPIPHHLVAQGGRRLPGPAGQSHLAPRPHRVAVRRGRFGDLAGCPPPRPNAPRASWPNVCNASNWRPLERPSSQRLLAPSWRRWPG